MKRSLAQFEVLSYRCKVLQNGLGVKLGRFGTYGSIILIN